MTTHTNRWFQVALLVVLLVAVGALAACGDDDGGGNNNNNENGTQGVCGDGNVDLGEACDDGVANSDSTPNACRTDCRLPRCGDAVVDDGEPCDDGNQVDEDSCTTLCALNTCGDGYLDASAEECDDGSANSDTVSDACRTTCLLPSCGDGVYDPASGEECDDRTLSEAGGCSNACTLQPGFAITGLDAPLNAVSHGDLQTRGSTAGTHLITYLAGNPAQHVVAVVLLDADGQVHPAALFPEQAIGTSYALNSGGADGYLLATALAPATSELEVRGLDSSGAQIGLETPTLPHCGKLQDAATNLVGDWVALNHERSLATCLVESADLRVHSESSGTDSLLSTSSNGGPTPQLVRAGDGFLAVWNEDYDVLGQILDADGTPTLPAPVGLVDVNRCVDFLGLYRAAALPDGTALLVWEATSGMGGCELRSRLIGTDGQPLGASQLLTTTTEGEITLPDVAATYDGDFFVAWQRSQGTTTEIRGRRVDGLGAPQGADEHLGDFVDNPPRISAYPRVSASSRGVLVVWHSFDAGFGYDVLLGTFLPRPVI